MQKFSFGTARNLMSEREDVSAAASQAQILYDKMLARIESEEDERAANISTGITRDAYELLVDDPAQRQVKDIKVVVEQLKDTAFFRSLPQERQDPAYWTKILRSAVVRRDLRAGTVLYDNIETLDSPDSVSSPEVIHSPTQLNRPSFGLMRSISRSLSSEHRSLPANFKLPAARKILKKLFIILDGGVQVMSSEEDGGSLLSSGDSFGPSCPVEDLAQPKSAIVFCDQTDVLEISTALMDRVHEMQMEECTNFLKSTRLFANLPEGVVDQITPLLQMKKYRTNEVIVRQGDPPTDLFIIAQGSVRVLKQVVVPYQMAKHGYMNTPAGTFLPVSESAVDTLAHAQQGCFKVKQSAEKTAKSARKMLKKPVGHESQSEQQRRLLDVASKEIQSGRGSFVSTVSRITTRLPRLHDQTKSNRKVIMAPRRRRFWNSRELL